jgi:quinol monooxygenase YgiN
MLLIVGSFRIPPHNMARLRPVMLRVIEGSRAEDGCIEYGYAEDVLEPGLIHLTERWTDQAALDRHFATPHIGELRAVWPDLGITDRDLRVYEVGEPRKI